MRHMATAGHSGCSLQITESSIGAAADEAHVHRNTLDGLTGGEVHIAISLFSDGAISNFELV